MSDKLNAKEHAEKVANNINKRPEGLSATFCQNNPNEPITTKDIEDARSIHEAIATKEREEK
jgi:hypothetical protein